MWNDEREYDDAIFPAGRRYGVPVPALLATAGIESGFEPNALNASDPGGAWGMFQMIPKTARGLGFNGPMDYLQTDVGTSADLAAKLWAQNLVYTGGDVLAAASAYNGGYRPAMGYGKMVNGKFANQAYVDRFYEAYVYFQDQVGKEGAAPVAASFRDVPRDRTVTSAVQTKIIPWAAVILTGVAVLGYFALRLMGSP